MYEVILYTPGIRLQPISAGLGVERRELWRKLDLAQAYEHLFVNDTLCHSSLVQGHLG